MYVEKMDVRRENGCTSRKWMYVEKMDVRRENGCTSRKWMYVCQTKEMYMQKLATVSTVVMALVLMGCPPPVSDNPGDSASGSNASAQNGDNPDNSAPAPVRKHHVAYVSVGESHSMIIKTDDTLWAVGNNDNGRLGDGSTEQKLNPVQVMEIPAEDGRPRAMTNVKQVSAGGSHTMILKKDDSLWAVGSNAWGQLSNNSAGQQQLNPIHIMSEVAQVSSNYQHTTVLKKDDTLWGFGNNETRQLGDNTTGHQQSNPRRLMTEVAQVSVGRSHTMILTKNDTLWGIGFNFYGQLGDGSQSTSHTPVQVMEKPTENGELRAMTNIKQISVGGSHTMILKKDDTLWGTGFNGNGQLGDGSTTNKLAPVQVMIDVAYVSAGHFHTMIIVKNGELWASGKNNKGQLGDGSTANKQNFVQVMEMPADGGEPRPMTAVAQVSVGKEHSMIVKKDGTLWAVGSNASGQLGNGDEKLATRFNPEQITPVAGCHDYFTEE